MTDSPAPLSLSEMPQVSDENRDRAAKIKQDANKAFTSHTFPAAEQLYTEAIDLNPTDPTLWCNRAYARMKLEQFGYALNDASQAIQLDPKYSKAYYRSVVYKNRATSRLFDLVLQSRDVLSPDPQASARRS